MHPVSFELNLTLFSWSSVYFGQWYFVILDEVKAIKSKPKKHKIFLDAMSKSFTQDCCVACYQSIEKQG